ncbi:ABC transporter substrate-binding protein [Streptomyces luteolus]|uniref:ABC transporter substrate-binding protein n=1 Tax=Streptomyces luteolus TaxID=3043615 RepID=A0ABT6SQC9_9ACTN|nr:ABC transporter substrate-binding protein [Streptomyces sp. B-S-A12]MDI3417601.1 ABC transporter substrate-binding protein [Streptomyces sp. B-S-A12]
MRNNRKAHHGCPPRTRTGPLARASAVTLALLLAATACGRGTEGGSTGEDGLATGPGFDGKTITVGVNSALTGPVAVVGKPLTEGNRVWFEHVNAEGGIAGKYKIELNKADSHYDAATAVQQYNRQKDDVVMFAQVLGTAITKAVLPNLKRDNVVAAPASQESQWVGEPNLAPLAAPYQIQAINALDHYRKQGGPDSTICSLVQDDASGVAAQEGVDFAARQLGFDVAARATYRVGDKDMTGPVTQLKRAKCDAVFLAGSPTDAGTALGTAAKMKFAPQWLGQSTTWYPTIGESALKPYVEEHLLIVSEGPEWGDTSVPAMAQMLKDQRKYAPKQEPSYYFAFGYVQAQLVTKILEKAVASGDLSRDGVAKAVNTLGKVEFGGLTGDYTYGPPTKRSPSRGSTMFKINMDKPFGLEAVSTNYSSAAAKAFTFDTP